MPTLKGTLALAALFFALALPPLAVHFESHPTLAGHLPLFTVFSKNKFVPESLPSLEGQVAVGLRGGSGEGLVGWWEERRKESST